MVDLYTLKSHSRKKLLSATGGCVAWPKKGRRAMQVISVNVSLPKEVADRRKLVSMGIFKE